MFGGLLLYNLVVSLVESPIILYDSTTLLY